MPGSGTATLYLDVAASASGNKVVAVGGKSPQASPSVEYCTSTVIPLSFWLSRYCTIKLSTPLTTRTSEAGKNSAGELVSRFIAAASNAGSFANVGVGAAVCEFPG